MKKEYYKDSQNFTAVIKEIENFYRLTVKDYTGTIIWDRMYSSYHGAKIAMGWTSDCWKRVETTHD
ncbi:hypothetical protein [Scatolibacter rhodanostii]|uniref:hypothetical protein n=1 Tax=Scatolibacter rhodanostii TaxID=2014781 RepID=UPI000C07E943|nr:hypothetical protein [Scatolibacter rhodanostii]